MSFASERKEKFNQESRVARVRGQGWIQPVRRARLATMATATALIFILMAGCSSSKEETSSPSPQPQPSQPATQQAAQAAKPSFNLKLPGHIPPTYSNQIAAEKWAKAVEEQTGGRIKVTLYPSESLVAAKDLLDSVFTGRTEMAILGEAYYTGALPILNIWDVPFLINGTPAAKKALDNGLRDLLREAYLERNIVVLDWNINSWISLSSAKKELRKPEELKGQRLRVHSSMAQQVTEKLGGSAVWMSSGDIYMGLQRNTIDGMWSGIDAVEKRKLYEVLKYLVDDRLTTSGYALAINKAVWDKIPPEDQKLMQELARKLFLEEQVVEVDRIDVQSIETIKSKGVTITKWTPAEREVWKNAVQPVAIEYFLSKTGERGQKAMDIAQKYGQ